MLISSSLLISLSQQFVGYSRNEIKKIDPELMRIKSLRYQEKVKVIVWLNENKSKESLNKIGRVNYNYSIIPAVAMEVPVNDLENLAKESSVEKIVPDRIVSAFRLESMEVIKASNASSTFSVNGIGVNISVIDTGIFNHTEFQSPNRIIKQKCYCNVTLNCCPDGTAESDNATDDEGHGTHCAGIAAGKGDGYTHGVATNASLFAVKVLNSAGGGRESDLIAGIEWSIQNGTKVISLSLGGNLGSYQCYDFSSSEVVDNATKQGVVMIVAAGNCGPGGSPIQCPVLGNQTIAAPACAKRVITVGNTDDNDNIASSSSRGSTKDNMTKPDLTAPGNSINSTYKDGGYYTDGGTSMSTPHAAGVAALLIQRYNQINGYYPNPDRVKAILITAVNTTGMNAAGYQQRNNIYGSGRIDAYEALRIINFTKNSTISTGEEHHYKINVTSTNFKTTLYWPEDKDTNNNLNLIIGNSTHNISYPTDPNDTVEQVFVDNANNGFWNVYVDCISGSNQTYYLASNMEISDDVTPPILILIKPENITYNNRTWVPLNFTTDMTNHTIWYTIDGENRTVITGNTTFNVSSDGQHNITLYVNDSYNNINQSTRYFSVDAVTPIINIVSPVSNLTMNYTTKSIWFNISLNENGNVSLCSVDGGGNFTLNSLNQTYFYNLSTISEGYHNVTFYVNDSVNWMNSSSINFTVMIKPNMTNSNVDKRLVLFNESVNITANIYDDNLNSTWINITWPNGLSTLRNMSNSSSSYYYLFNDTNQIGNYNVTIFANDTFGNFNNVSVNFTVSDSVNVSSTVTNGSVSVNVSVKIFYNGTSQIRNQTINTIFDFIIPSGLWDLGINTTQLNVTLFNVNLTQNFTRDIKFNDDIQMGNLSSNVNTLKTVAIKFDNFTFSSANLTFLFNPNLVNNYSNLNVYKCHNWSFTNSNCSSNWQKDSDDTTFNAIINNNNVTLFTLNFSAFSLSENQTTTTTTTTTIAATTTTVSSGDGGDGGSNPTTTTTTSTISTTSTIETTVSSRQQPSGTTTTTVVEEEKIVTHEIKAWYIIPVLIVAISIVVFWYVKYYKESGEDIVFKTLKEKWGQHIFVVNFSLT
jgi:serine protease AprX